MSVLYDFDGQKFVRVYAGYSIQDACEEAEKLSDIIEKDVCFMFNGLFISTDIGCAEDMVEHYHDKISRRG